MQGDAVDAVPDVCGRLGNVLGSQSSIDGLPVLSPIIAAEGAGCRDGDEDPLAVAWILNDRMQAHAAGPWLPARPCAVAPQPGQLAPGLAAVGGAEQCRILDSGVNRVRIREPGLEVPDPFELPRSRRSVIPLVRGERFTGF